MRSQHGVPNFDAEAGRPHRAVTRTFEPQAESLRDAVQRQATILIAIAALAAPALTPLAPAVRWSFPATAGLLAVWLALRGRPGAYVTACLWLFMLTPLVRRLVDLQIGFSDANVLMLAPYLALGGAALRAPRFFLMAGAPGQGAIAVLLICIFYGFVLAVAGGGLIAGVVDLLRWTAPPLLACYIISERRRWLEICNELRALALLALPLVSAYGLYQFVAPPGWDAQWMIHADMNSIGQPAPFAVRVFGPLNSPASFAYWLEALILLNLCLRTRLAWPGVAIGLCALAVTLVRSAWLGTALGLLLLLSAAPLRARLSVLVLGAGLAFAGPLALSHPEIERVVASRLATFSDLSGDKSFDDRARAYTEGVGEVLASPWGQGLGVANVAAKFADRHRVVDGGPLEVLLSLGLFFGAAYLAVAATLLVSAVARPRPVLGGDVFAFAAAIIVVQALAMSSVTTLIGEIGVLFWLGVGLVLSSPGARGRLSSTGNVEVTTLSTASYGRTIATNQPNLAKS